VELAAQVEELKRVKENERKLIAYEPHDDATQYITIPELNWRIY
jgi:hypothetical protein